MTIMTTRNILSWSQWHVEEAGYVVLRPEQEYLVCSMILSNCVNKIHPLCEEQELSDQDKIWTVIASFLQRSFSDDKSVPATDVTYRVSACQPGWEHKLCAKPGVKIVALTIIYFMMGLLTLFKTQNTASKIVTLFELDPFFSCVDYGVNVRFFLLTVNLLEQVSWTVN